MMCDAVSVTMQVHTRRPAGIAGWPVVAVGWTCHTGQRPGQWRPLGCTQRGQCTSGRVQSVGLLRGRCGGHSCRSVSPGQDTMPSVSVGVTSLSSVKKRS